MYCFAEQCSQILPPLTKHQLFITGITSCILFVVTICLYIVIFHGVKKQSNKLKQHISQSRSPTPKSPKPPKEIPNFQNQKAPESPQTFMKKQTVAGWRNNLATLNEHGTPTPTSKRQFRFSAAINPGFEMPEDDTLPDMALNTPKYDANRMMGRQESNMTTMTELSPTSTPSSEFVRFQAVTNGTNNFTTDPESGINGSIPKFENSTVQVVMRPKTLQTKNENAEENRRSRSTFMTTINRLTRRGKRRTTASRKRDLRVMRSMFIILSVFIATTAPLMFFVIYTFPYNDRDLKEIFNYLLQVILSVKSNYWYRKGFRKNKRQNLVLKLFA